MTSEFTTFNLPFRSFVYGFVPLGESPAEELILAGNRGQLQQQQLPPIKSPPKSTSLRGLTLTLDITFDDDASVGSLTSEAVDGPLQALSRCYASGLSSKLLSLYLASSNTITYTPRLPTPLSLAPLHPYPTARGRPIYFSPQPCRPTNGRVSQQPKATDPRQISKTPGARPTKTQARQHKNQNQVFAVDKKAGVLQAAFGCLIGKYEGACQEPKCHWKSFRSLCRSAHLDRHKEKGDLNGDQLVKIRNAPTGLNGHDTEVEKWRDCFLELHPEFADRRAELNPYFGEPLLPGGEHPPTVFDRLLEEIDDVMTLVRDRPRNPLFQVPTPRLDAPGITPALPAQIVPTGPSHGHSRLGGTSNRSREVVSLPENPRQRPLLPNTPGLTHNRPPFQEISRMSHHGHEDRFPAPPSRRPASQRPLSDIDDSVIDPRLRSNQYNDDAVFSQPPTPQRRPTQVSAATTPSMYTGDTAISHVEGRHTTPAPFFPERNQDLVPSMWQDLPLPSDNLLEIDQDIPLFQEESGASGSPSAGRLTAHPHPGSGEPVDPPMLYVSPGWLSLKDTTRWGDQHQSKKRAREPTP